MVLTVSPSLVEEGEDEMEYVGVGVVEVSRIVRDSCVSRFWRLASEKSWSLSDSDPSVVLSCARVWVREKTPDVSMADEP